LVVGLAPGDPIDLLTRITAPVLAQFFNSASIITSARAETSRQLSSQKRSMTATRCS